MSKHSMAWLPIVSLLLLGGCVAVWGGSYDVLTKSSDVITIQYDTNFTDDKAVGDIATQHCAQYGRKAVRKADTTNLMNITTATYTCDIR